MWLDELRRADLIRCYNGTNGKHLLFLPTWGRHQRIRQNRSKYEAPSSDNICQHMPRVAASCRELPRVAASCRELPRVAARHEHEHEHEQIQKQELQRTDQKQRVVLTDDQFLLALRANPAFQHLDLTAELARMDAWLLAHPARKKTRRFIVAWLNRVERPVVVVTPKRNRTLSEEREDSWLAALPKTLADFVRARAKVEPRDLEGLTPPQRAAYDAIIKYRRADVPGRAKEER